MDRDAKIGLESATESGADTNVAIGTIVFGTYEIRELISVGGMGEVFRGRNVHSRDLVAVKTILTELAHDPQIETLFRKEANVLGRLDHDSIVRYHFYSFDEGVGRHCLVMDYVEGCNLTDYIRRGPIAEELVRTLIRRLAGGLGQAHEFGIVHRDLTPNNVLLPNDTIENAKLIDFGLAKGSAVKSGFDGQFAGTLDFASPEQLGKFGGEVDARSDIYSLGLMILACCRGEVLNMGESAADAVHARRAVPDMSDIYANLRPILSLMLAPNPDHRPESMARVIELLEMPADVLSAALPVTRQPVPTQSELEQRSETDSGSGRASDNLKTTPPTTTTVIEAEARKSPLELHTNFRQWLLWGAVFFLGAAALATFLL